MLHDGIDGLAEDQDAQLELKNIREALEEKGKDLEREHGRRLDAEAVSRLNEDRLNALLGLSQLRNATEEELNDRVLEDSVRLTGSELGYLHFVDAQETGFISYVWSKGAARACGTAREAMDFSLTTAGIWADSLRLRLPVVHNDYRSMSGAKGLPDGHIPISRIMSVPVLKDGKVVAILGVANKSTFYDEADQRQLLLFGNKLWSILEAKRAEISLAAAYEELHRLSILDSLTGLANRRGLDEYLESLRKVDAWNSSAISVFMIDIDFFKAYNDRYGHLAGDAMLEHIGGLFLNAIRGLRGMAARYGGDEFLIIIPDMDRKAAEATAESLLSAVRALGRPQGGPEGDIGIAVSIGVAASNPTAVCRPESLFKRADKALYEAKRQGRNRVVPAEPTTGDSILS
jgi:diguanylate cyclase (GGDEF)-like protein